MDTKETNDMRCPTCGYVGQFNKGKPRFFIFDSWHYLVERNAARRSLVCPNCGTKVMISKGSWIPYVLMLSIYAIALLGAVIVSFFFLG